MSSRIDPAKPEDGVPAVKADLRANLAAAKAEIEALQALGGVSPETHGAAGDGTTNDTTALQNAVNAAISAAVPLRLRQGATYLVQSPISVNGTITIVGPGAAIKANAGSWSGFAVMSISNAPGSRFVGFELDGSDIGNNLVYCEDSADCIFDGLYIHNLVRTTATRALLAMNGTNHRALITRCRFEDLDGNGAIARAIWMYNGSGKAPPIGIRIIGNVFRELLDSTDTDAIVPQAGAGGLADVHRHLIVSNNYFENCAKRCVKVMARGALVIGNSCLRTISGNQERAFVSAYHADVSVIGNNVEMKGGGYTLCVDTGSGGSAPHRLIVANNRFSRDTSVNQEAIDLKGGDAIIVAGNHFHGVYRNFVVFRNAQHGARFIGNVIHDPTTQQTIHQISAPASHNVTIANNILRHNSAEPINAPSGSEEWIVTGNFTTAAIGSQLINNVTGLTLEQNRVLKNVT